MPDIVGCARLARRRERAAGQGRAEDLDEKREAIALVAAHLARAADRVQPALRPLHRVKHRLGGVGHRRAVAVDHPARRDIPAVERIDFDLVRGDDARRDVEEHRRIAPGGCGEGERIGAEHRLGAEGRDQRGGARRGRDEPDHAALRRHRGIDAGGTEMMRVEHRDDREPVCRRLVEGKAHGEDRDRMAEPAIGVDQRHDRGVPYDLRARRRVELPLLADHVVERQHRDAVRIDAAEIGVDHDCGRWFAHPPRPCPRRAAP